MKNKLNFRHFVFLLYLFVLGNYAFAGFINGERPPAREQSYNDFFSTKCDIFNRSIFFESIQQWPRYLLGKSEFSIHYEVNLFRNGKTFEYLSYYNPMKRFDIINPELPYLIGIEFGPSLGLISGNYNDPKTSCDYLFDSGDGPGFYFELVGTLPLDYGTNIELTLGYSQAKITSSDSKNTLRTVRGEPDPIPINMEANADFEFSFLNVSASIKQNILFDNFYILGGFRIRKNLTGELEVSESIKDEGYVFGGSYKTEDYIFPKADIPGKNDILYALQGGLLYEIPFFDSFILAPKINVIYPLNSLIADNSFKMMNINIGLQILYSY